MLRNVSSQRKMGPRVSSSTEEHLKMIKSRLESVHELDETFLQLGFGLLLIDKSANDFMFRMLVASIKSSKEDTRDQARRALSRWARSNQRVDQAHAYSSLVEKAGKLPPDKRETVVTHFKSIPTLDDGGEPARDSEYRAKEHEIFRNPIEALRAVRGVSRSLLDVMETPPTELERPGAASTPAEVAVPEEGVEQSSELECPEGKTEKNNAGRRANAKRNDEEQKNALRKDRDGMTQFAQTSMSLLPEAPHLASAISRHSKGLVSPPDPPALAKPKRNYPVRNRNSCGEAILESGTCPTSTGRGTMAALEVAESKEGGGIDRRKGCGRAGANTIHQRQTGAGGQGRKTRTAGVQTFRRGLSKNINRQLEQVASSIAELAAQQAATEQKLTASLERIEDAINRYLERSQRTDTNSEQRAAEPAGGVNVPGGTTADTLPVAEVVGVTVGTSDNVEAEGRSTENERTRQGAVEVGQAQRGISIPNGGAPSILVHQRIFAMYGGGR